MLHELVNYATKHGLPSEPGFVLKYARWAIACSASGEYLKLIELGDPGAKNNKGKPFPKAPEMSRPALNGGGGKRCHFLVETVSVVACLGQDAREKRRNEDKHAYFVELLDQAATALPELSAAARALRTGLQRLRADLEERRARATDKITIWMDGEFPVNSDRWHGWWRTFLKGLAARKPAKQRTEGGRMLCFITGDVVKPAATHDKITGLVGTGGLTAGDVLVGFNKQSYQSYGLEDSANAAMSAEAAKVYVDALNDLLANHSSLVAGTRVVHWFGGRVAAEDDPLAWLIESEEAEELNAQIRARKLLESIRTGERPDLAKNTYFALTLSGNSGRVMVRDWMEGSFESLVSNVNQWFSDLEIVKRDGSGSAKPSKLAAVLATLARELKDVPARVAAKLYRVAVRREPIPLEAMAQALARVKVDVIQGESANHARMGLIKAYHLRKEKREGTMGTQLQPALNPEIADPAYQCGRLMAVLAKVQTKALGDVGAGVVQRYYAAASATPALVFGRLVRGAQFHLNKIEPNGLARWYERQIVEVCGCIGRAMPATLSLEEQSRFALGYYQQLAAFSAGKSENSKEAEDHE